MRIVDCFPYFNEVELLELRIRLLHDHVDKFIITEGDRTHSGDKKPFTCKKTLQELGLYSDKIEVIEVNLPSREEKFDNWVRENKQRDVAAELILEDDIAIFSDLDEIIDPQYIGAYSSFVTQNPDKLIRIGMWCLVGRGDLHLIASENDPALWGAAFVCLKSHLREYTPSQLRQSYTRNLNNIRFVDAFISENGSVKLTGWHFTWMGGSSRMIEKYTSIADSNDSLDSAVGKGEKSKIIERLMSYVPQDRGNDPLGRKDHVLRRYDISLLPNLVFQIPRVNKLLFPDEQTIFKMNRTSLINALIAQNSAKSYLEIGISSGYNFNRISCANRTAVDPVRVSLQGPHKFFEGTSDSFFASIGADTKFDVIFIDGLHTAQAVKADILNAMKHLGLGGFIICHDMNPQREEHQVPEYRGGHWNGDGWKAFVELRGSHGDAWTFLTVDTDEGCGVIFRGGSTKLNITGTLDWNGLCRNRSAWLNLISIDQFVSKILGGFTLPHLLNAYVGDPEYDENNFALALYYDQIDQKAAAVSFYLRAAERTNKVLLQYEALIRGSLCFLWQGTRGLSVRGLLQRAISILPKRPEAYFLLARWYEREAQIESWVNCYTTASMALEVCEFNGPSLRTNVEYPGKYGLIFEKAVSGWWVGQCEEAKNLFIELHKIYPLDAAHRTAVINNLNHLKQFNTKSITAYDHSKHDRLKFKFNGSEMIGRNFSESYQDMFVLAMLDGKKNGTYLEIGSARPFYGNNTALLERDYGWYGVSLDLDESFVKEFNAQRKNTCLHQDATKADYTEILKSFQSKDIDYLQIDVDPAEISLAVLKTIPFDTHRFAVITFEHDAYTQVDTRVREESRKYLTDKGYTLVGRNIAPDHWRYYEDWWVHKDLVDTSVLRVLSSPSEAVKSAESFMLT